LVGFGHQKGCFLATLQCQTSRSIGEYKVTPVDKRLPKQEVVVHLAFETDDSKTTTRKQGRRLVSTPKQDKSTSKGKSQTSDCEA
jgi:hypothetical protein